MKFRHE